MAILEIGVIHNSGPQSRALHEVIESMKSLLERWRTRRLASVYVLLATFTVAIVAGSYAAHGVRGQEEHDPSSDASPLKVVDTAIQPNDFTRIAKGVGPAVVN